MHKYNNGDVYIGEWSEDRPNGKGLNSKMIEMYFISDLTISLCTKQFRLESGVITTTHGDTYDGKC